MQHQPTRPLLRLPRSALDRWLGRLALLMVALSSLLFATHEFVRRFPSTRGR